MSTFTSKGFFCMLLHSLVSDINQEHVNDVQVQVQG